MQQLRQTEVCACRPQYSYFMSLHSIVIQQECGPTDAFGAGVHGDLCHLYVVNDPAAGAAVHWGIASGEQS